MGHPGHEDQQVQGHSERLAGERVLSLDEEVAVLVLGDFRDTAPDEDHAVFLLGFEIHVLVSASEHTEVHIETVHYRIRKLLLDLAGLLDGRGAAYLGAVAVAYLLVTGAHAVYESYAARIAYSRDRDP